MEWPEGLDNEILARNRESLENRIQKIKSNDVMEVRNIASEAINRGLPEIRLKVYVVADRIEDAKDIAGDTGMEKELVEILLEMSLKRRGRRMRKYRSQAAELIDEYNMHPFALSYLKETDRKRTKLYKMLEQP